MLRPRLAGLPVLLLALLAACGGGDGGGGGPAPAEADVLTRNLYLGAGLDPLFAPASLADLPAAVGALWRQVQASDPAARMEKVADEIAARRPHLVGLQEAALFRTSPPPPGVETVAYDFVALLLGALRDRGVPYRAVATATNFDASLPDDAGLTIRFTDRDVILARDDVSTSDPRSARFAATLQVPIGLVPVAVPRGWTSVRAEVGGGLRLVNTHLEAASDPIQEEQARELVALVQGDAGRVVLVGDLNSFADRTGTATYGLVRDAGFADAWEEVRPGEAGLTCCFAPDVRAGALGSRIDLVLHRGAIGPVSAEVVGEEPADRTAAGLWPSDHAGVAAGLRAR